MKTIVLFLTLTIPIFTMAQCDGRYETEVFSEVEVSTIEYSDVYNWSLINTGLDMDVYQPVGDLESNRPLIIFAHGGTFVAGDKDNFAMVELCEAFAKRGYVTASIQYRLTSSFNLILPNANEILTQTVVNAIGDMKAAVRYFRKDVAENDNSYRINEDLIFVGGYSAGAITAMHLAMLDEGEVPSDLQAFVDDMDGLEGNSGNPGYSSEVSGVVSLAGAIFSTNFIDQNDVPVYSAHAVDDGTVLYNCGSPLNNSSFSELCGSGQIHEKLNDLEILNDLTSFSSGDHAAPLTNLTSDCIPNASNFLFQFVCDDNQSFISEEIVTVSAFPNPVVDLLRINSDYPMRSVELFDQKGNLLLRLEKINSNQTILRLAKLNKGLTTLVVKFEGKSDISRKIIKI